LDLGKPRPAVPVMYSRNSVCEREDCAFICVASTAL
jgi:hypothetical protein